MGIPTLIVVGTLAGTGYIATIPGRGIEKLGQKIKCLGGECPGEDDQNYDPKNVAGSVVENLGKLLEFPGALMMVPGQALLDSLDNHDGEGRLTTHAAH